VGGVKHRFWENGKWKIAGESKESTAEITELRRGNGEIMENRKWEEREKAYAEVAEDGARSSPRMVGRREG
jgi:hypothetical protein